MKPPVIVNVISSPVVRAGVTAIVGGGGELQGAKIVSADAADVLKTVVDHDADIVITDYHSLDSTAVAALRNNLDGELSVVLVQWDSLPESVTARYDAVINIFDTPARVAEALKKCTRRDDDDTRRELSPREKDVIIGVVKGLSNKEIADRLNVSTHTVMTHRRNIAAKLQIHSPAGLTIYAIVSRLVNLDEVKDMI